MKLQNPFRAFKPKYYSSCREKVRRWIRRSFLDFWWFGKPPVGSGFVFGRPFFGPTFCFWKRNMTTTSTWVGMSWEKGKCFHPIDGGEGHLISFGKSVEKRATAVLREKTRGTVTS
jgi:hypothetical protein